MITIKECAAILIALAVICGGSVLIGEYYAGKIVSALNTTIILKKSDRHPACQEFPFSCGEGSQ